MICLLLCSYQERPCPSHCQCGIFPVPVAKEWKPRILWPVFVRQGRAAMKIREI